MNGETLVIGRVNAGKTSFCLRLARPLKLRELNWLVERTDGVREKRRMLLSEADAILSSDEPNRTREMQTLLLSVPRGKSDQVVRVTDSAGLMEGLHENEDVRRAMAQTLRAMIAARGIFHVVDAAALGRMLAGQSKLAQARMNALDEQMFAMGQMKDRYVILANKMDLPMAREGYRWLKAHAAKYPVVPISARDGTGFNEVRRHVWRLA